MSSTGGGAETEKKKPAAAHAVFFPFPAQGHVTAALQLATLLHARGGVRVTFVHSDRNRRRVLRTRGPAALAGTPGFAFASIPDCLPRSSEDDDGDSPQVMAGLLSSLHAFVPHLKKLLHDISASGSAPPATCVVSDMDPVLRAAADVGVPALAFWTTSACGLLASLHCQQLIDKGIVPLKDAEQLRDEYLDSTVIARVPPGFPADMRLRDMVSFVRTTDADDPMLRVVLGHMQAIRKAATAVVLNTFGELEGEVVAAMSAAVLRLPPIYTVGPLPLLVESAARTRSSPTLSGSQLTKEDDGCLTWLESKEPGSVVYANFGSIVVLTSQQMEEFAWGLANSGYQFLMVIRQPPAAKALPPEFAEVTNKGRRRGYVTSWCPQREVLRHRAIGAFLTHCGWNSMLEGICSGVPMLCWPFGADQHTNRRFACTEWRVGVEIAGDVRRGEVEKLVRDVMGGDGEHGRELRARASQWKERAAAAASQPDGSSWVNLDRLIKEVFQP